LDRIALTQAAEASFILNQVSPVVIRLYTLTQLDTVRGFLSLFTLFSGSWTRRFLTRDQRCI